MKIWKCQHAHSQEKKLVFCMKSSCMIHAYIALEIRRLISSFQDESEEHFWGFVLTWDAKVRSRARDLKMEDACILMICDELAVRTSAKIFIPLLFAIKLLFCGSNAISLKIARLCSWRIWLCVCTIFSKAGIPEPQILGQRNVVLLPSITTQYSPLLCISNTIFSVCRVWGPNC